MVRSSRLRANSSFPPSLWGLAYTPGKFSFRQRGASFAIIVSWQSSFGRAWSDSAVSRGMFVSRGRWVGDLAQEWTFVGTFPPLNTFPTGPRPVFFLFTVVVALFPVCIVLSVFCFRSCPFARLFLPVLARSFLGCGCRSISSYCPGVDLTVFCFRSCPFALVIFCFWFVSVHVEKRWLYTSTSTLAKKIETTARRWGTGECSLEHARACRFASRGCLNLFFLLARVSRSNNVNAGNRQADRGCTSRRCDQ